MNIMNIRGLSNPALVLGKERVEEQKRNLKSDQATDRDANGQQTYDDGSGQVCLSDEQMEKALKMIQNHPGFSDNGLEAKIEHQGSLKYIAIYSPDSQLIKRINETSLAQYLESGGQEAFHLVSRTA